MKLLTFVATEFSEGREWCRRIRAYGWPEAEFIARALGWRLDGILVDEFDA